MCDKAPENTSILILLLNELRITKSGAVYEHCAPKERNPHLLD